MADKYWQPKAEAVKQVSTVQVTGFDATTTYALSVNGVAVASVLGTTDANGTASALSTAWNNANHVYATGITASVSTDTVTLTADEFEVPFTVVSSDTGGSGTIGAVSTTTAATGPHTLNEAENWDGEALPVNDDVLFFRDSTQNICWGLESLTTTGHTVHIEASFTGKMGLNRSAFATSADGETVESAAPEYRPLYMQLDIARLEIGAHAGPGSPGGSPRIMVDNDRASASQTVIHSSATVSSETGKPPVRLLLAHSGADIDARNGQVGIAVDEPGETSTVGDIVSREAGVFTGDGVTLTNYTQHGGTSLLNLGAATLTLALVHDGLLTIEGGQAITTLRVTGGEAVCNTTGTVSTCTHEGGRVDYSQGAEARTVTNHQLFRGATLITNDDVVTITNLLEPDGPSVIAVS